MIRLKIAASVIAAAIVLVAPGAARAQSARPTIDTAGGRWTVDDILLSEDAKTFTLSRDGRRVAWIRTAMSTETGRVVSTLFVSPVSGGPAIQLTRGNRSVSSPRWSPDGKRIAFLGGRAGTAFASGDARGASTQIWLIDADGGEAWPATHMDNAPDDFAWKGSDTLLFIGQPHGTGARRKYGSLEDDSRAVDDSTSEAPVRLFALEVASGTVKQITDNNDWIEDFALSPDGARVVTVHKRSLAAGYDQKTRAVTRLLDVATGAGRTIFDGNGPVPSDITWSHDGRGFYYTNDTTTHARYRTATIGVLDYYDVASGRVVPVDHSWQRGVVGNLRAAPDGVVANLGDGVFIRPARYTRRGTTNTWDRTFLAGARADHSFDVDISRDARSLVYRYTRANVPPQLYAAKLDRARIFGDTLLTDLNPSLRNKPQPKVEIVHWKGARDEEVEGILTYPLNFREGERYPLILTIHGGPALADLDEWKQTWSYPRILLNQKGALTLQVNYHGSSRYGLRWVESICCGNIYDLETPDLERAIDYVVGRGLADTARLGTLGHSYGAILSTQLTTVDQRFKAASAAAGDVEWLSDWGAVSFGASYDNYYFGASPWDNPDIYIRKSPVFRLKNVRTPTIIYHGTDDTQVPVGQSWTYFRALQQLGVVPVRFILFPGEPHSPRQYAHQRRKVDEDMAWFDRYLFH